MSTEARATIVEIICDALTVAVPGIGIQTDVNASFTPPQDALWARIAFRDGAKDVAAIGGNGNLWRGPLLAYVDIFAPLGSGDGEVTTACKSVRDACRGINREGLKVRRFEAGPEGTSNSLYRKQQIVVFDHSERG